MFCPNKSCGDYRATGFHAEFVEGVTACPTCGAQLVATIAPEEPAPETFAEGPSCACPLPVPGSPFAVEPVYETEDPREVQAIRAALDSAWIPHVVKPGDELKALPAGPSPMEYEPQAGALVILVPASIAEEVRALLEELDETE